MRSPRPHTLAIVVALLIGPPVVAAHAQVVFQYDHATGKLSVVDGADRVQQLPNGNWRLQHPGSVRLDVVHTNTAIYKVAFDTGSAPAPLLDPLRQFLTRAKPFFPELAFAVNASGPKSRGMVDQAGGPTGQGPSVLPATVASNSQSVQAALASGRLVEQDLHALDSLVHGARGIDGVTALSLRTLERMRYGDATTLANALRDSAGLSGRACDTPRGGRDSLALAGDVLRVMDDLTPSTQVLHRVLVDTIFTADTSLRGVHERLLALRQAADTALQSEEAITAAAYRAERLVRAVGSACSERSGNPQALTEAAGRVLIVKIEPSTDPELARVADRGSAVAKVTVLPPLGLIEPSFGLSFVVAPNATYKQYATRTAATGGTEIYVPSTRDQRFGWGATLGITWRGVNGHEGSGFSLWLPELTVGEATSSPAFGVGSAVSYSIVKLGAGALWVRHTELAGDQTVGEKITNDKFLQTRDTYGRPTFYMALSVFEWPPFLPK